MQFFFLLFLYKIGIYCLSDNLFFLIFNFSVFFSIHSVFFPILGHKYEATKILYSSYNLMISNVLIIIIYNIALTNLNFGTWINISSVISFGALVITLLLMYLPKLTSDTKKIGIEPHDIIYIGEKDANSDQRINSQTSNSHNNDSKYDDGPTASYTNTNENILYRRSDEIALNSRSGENVFFSRSGKNVLYSRSGENVLYSRSAGDCSMMTPTDVDLRTDGFVSGSVDEFHES